MGGGAASLLLLAGLFEQWQQLSGDLNQAFAAGPAKWRELWQRDRGLLGVAGAARAKRLSNALATLAVDAGQ